MTTATATAVTYRKTSKGEWVAFGPVSAMPDLRPGINPEVTVSKRDGTSRTERVTGFGRPFQVGGVTHVYAYLAKSAPASRSGSRPSASRDRWTRADGTCRCYCHSQSYGPGVDGSFDGCDRCGCDGDC